jgi:hypothetical protein
MTELLWALFIIFMCIGATVLVVYGLCTFGVVDQCLLPQTLSLLI